MKLVKYTGKTPEYLDDFPKDCERSCKGSLHLLPNAQKEISDDELKHLKKKYPKLKVVLVPKEKPAIKRVKQAVAKKAPKVESKGEGEQSKSKKNKKGKKS